MPTSWAECYQGFNIDVITSFSYYISVLSVKDYLDIRNMNGKNMVREQLPKVGSSVSSQNLPSFLFAQDDVQSRRLTNYTLNLAHKFKENERLEFISTFNVLSQSEQTINQQTFFDNKSNNIFDLGFRTQYNFNKNIPFYLNAQNILNIRSDNTKNNLIITPYYTQEVIMRTLSGFLSMPEQFFLFNLKNCLNFSF